MGFCPFISNKSIALLSLSENGIFGVEERFLSFDCPESSSCKIWNDSTKKCDLTYSSEKTDVEEKEKEADEKKKKDEKKIPEIPYYVNLVSEFFGNEDRDKNKKIYGKDFKITDDDEKPKALRGLETHPDWIEPEETMTWEEYIESMKEIVDEPPSDEDPEDPDDPDNPTDACDKDHLSLCLNETDCTTATGFWYNNKCNKDKKTEEVCSETSLQFCKTEIECGDAGGLWQYLNNTCIPFDSGAIRCSKDHLNACSTRKDCLKFGGFWYKLLGLYGSESPEACYKESQKYQMIRVTGGNPKTWYGQGNPYNSTAFKISEIEIYSGLKCTGTNLCKNLKYTDMICSTENKFPKVIKGISDGGGFKENAVDGDKNTSWKSSEADPNPWWGFYTIPIDIPRSFRIKSAGFIPQPEGQGGVYLPKTIKLQGAIGRSVGMDRWYDLTDEFPTKDTLDIQEFS